MIGSLRLWKSVEKLRTGFGDERDAVKSGSRAAALHTSTLRVLAEDIGVEEVVAEFSVGVEFFGKG